MAACRGSNTGIPSLTTKYCCACVFGISYYTAPKMKFGHNYNPPPPPGDLAVNVLEHNLISSSTLLLKTVCLLLITDGFVTLVIEPHLRNTSNFKTRKDHEAHSTAINRRHTPSDDVVMCVSARLTDSIESERCSFPSSTRSSVGYDGQKVTRRS